MLNIHSIETFGTQEGPGIRLVLFLQGCNMKCAYCHNPDTQAVCGGEKMGIKKILALLENEKVYFIEKGGLTVSGGEPTLQAKELVKLFQKVKDMGIHTALDTNGSIMNSDVKKLYSLSDLVIMDIKHINDGWHKRITGIGNENVLANARYREEMEKPMWLRYVLVPGYSDQEKYIDEWGNFFHNYKSVERVEIIPYHTLGAHKYEAMGRKYKLKNVSSPAAEQVEKARRILEKYFWRVY
ncbi:MAG: pyruvate formate-lyase-activating protein [bacterium]